MQELLTTAQAAQQLGVTPETVRSFARRGLLTVAMRPPNGFLFTARDVQRLVKQRAKDNGNR